MTDKQLILDYLKGRVGKWVNGIDLSKTLKPYSVSWAYRSRISNIKKELNEDPFTMYSIESRIGNNRMAEYRIVIL